MITIVLAALLFSIAPAVSAQTATPATGGNTILQTTAGMGNLNTFTSLANKAGLGDTLNTGGPYTVLAPSDDAFKKLPPGTLDALSNDAPRLKAVMRNHVLPGRHTANDILAAQKVVTLDNKVLPVVPRQGSILVNNNAFLTKEDIPAGGNNIVQVIDNVLIPS
jgi:uncharacterized surface protein with fasciclin (FAS1) repeats